MSLTLKIILSIALTIGIWYPWKDFLSWLLEKIREDIANFNEEMRRKFPQEVIRIDDKFGPGSEVFIKDRARRLGYLTTIVSLIELFFFGILTLLLMLFGNEILDGVVSFMTLFGGWLTIKTITNYDQWSHKIAGKAYLYTSIFGTLFNVIFSFATGMLIFYLFFS